ncbi:MAG: DUF2281 domain-containing protein [Bacteroidetes bacterium]|nr:DUF2281 domain-containing protein [Bacteroidota bacterium]
MTSYAVFSKLESLPPELKQEAIDFIDYLSLKNKKRKPVKNTIPLFGSVKGKIKLSEDFDSPLDTFKDYM